MTIRAVWLAAVAVLAAVQPVVAATSLIDSLKAGDRAGAMQEIARQSGVNLASPDDGSTPLLWAVHYDDAAMVTALLCAGADARAANSLGDTPMREAATNGDVTLLKALLDAGADVDSPSAEGQTNLMILARTANVEAAGLLLDRGANPNAVENYELQSALMWAAEQQQAEMVRLLVSKGADVNARSREHDYVARVTDEPRVRYDPTGGMTPLMFAAREGCIDCAKLLVGAGARLDAADRDGATPLILAISNAHFDLAAYLTQVGADVNRWDFWGRTPLWAAVDYNTIPVGGRADRPSVDETTPLALIKQLLAGGANPNAQLKFFPPFRAARYDRSGDQIYNTGATPLLRAARAGDTDVVELLLKAGARTDLAVAPTWLKTQNTAVGTFATVGGDTPIMVAAGLGNQPSDTRGKYKTEAQAVATVKLLAAAGADVNARNIQGDTALHGAVLRGWNEVVRTLIERGADPYQPNDEGKSPADIAASRDSRLIVSQIVDVNAETATLIAQLKPQSAPLGAPVAKRMATKAATKQ